MASSKATKKSNPKLIWFLIILGSSPFLLALIAILLIAFKPSEQKSNFTDLGQVTTSQNGLSTYTDSDLGWLIDYDQNQFEAPNIDENGNAHIHSSLFNPCIKTLSIYSRNNPENLSLAQYVQAQSYAGNPQISQESIFINGLESIKLSATHKIPDNKGNTREQVIENYYLANGQNIVILSYDNQAKLFENSNQCENNEGKVLEAINSFKLP